MQIVQGTWRDPIGRLEYDGRPEYIAAYVLYREENGDGDGDGDRVENHTVLTSVDPATIDKRKNTD